MDIDSVAKLQDLRVRILNKEPISKEEMFAVLTDLRKGRRSAAETKSAKKKQPILPDDLNDLLNSNTIDQLYV